MKNWFLTKRDQLKKRFFDENLEMENKLSNLIMLCTVCGCLVAFIISLFVNVNAFASATVFGAFAVVSLCLYLAAWQRKNKLAALLVVLIIDEIIFPIMYIASGGIHSGMVCWLILGLIFPFLVLQGFICFAIFALGLITLGGMFVLEYFQLLPLTIEPLTSAGWVEDTVQSMALVAFIFGVIFKFQARLYTKQANELKKREKELQESMLEIERANQAKSDFLANMSHEIRTPINAIMGMNEIILRDSQDKEVIQNSVNIQNASNNLLSLVNDILDFSKIEAGKMELICSEYRLSSLLADCYNLINMRAFNKGLDFSVNNSPDIPERLYGDEFRIRQVVVNLLTNAVKYTRQGSVKLCVSYENRDEENILVKFAIHDTGVGISEDNKQLLFKSFQRIDEKRNRSIEGTGLGLTITARLVEQMGGEILVESELGKGSVFTAVIPQKKLGEEVLGDFKERYTKSQTRNQDEVEVFKAPGMKILAVDDVKTNLAVVKGLLKKSEIELTTALSGAEMLALSEKIKFDLILLDHMMPEMDGIEAFRELKRRNNINADTPVVALTANAIKGVEEEYLAEGFSGYLSKPVHGKNLEDIIKKYM